jgi:glucan biosynthesis protein C
MTTIAESERFHALDAIRAFALILGIVLHGTLSFLPGVASIGWPIADRSPSLLLEVAFYVVHVFRMSVFFVIAGFFAHLTFHSKGAAGFMRNRAIRILVPLVVGYSILTPLQVAVIFWAFMKSHGGALPTRLHGDASRSIPLTHLWFLYYLLIFYAITLTARAIILGWIDSQGVMLRMTDRVIRLLLNSYAAPFVLAAPIAACLYITRPLWVVPTPEFGLTPQPSAIIAFGTAFVFGWLLHRQADLLSALARRWALNAAFAISATAAAWMIVGAPLAFDARVPSSVRLIYAMVYAIAIWTWVFAIMGFAVRYCFRPRASVRYVADSSYWMYLVHAPLVLALQTLVMYWPGSWVVKFPFILLVAFSLLLLSYRYFVRFTFVGAVLNGRRYRPSVAPPVAPIVMPGRDDLA